MAHSSAELSKTKAMDAVKIPVRVLHVDDEADFLKTAEAILEMQGEFQVETASSVEEAWEKMKKEEYDVIICDYQMPGKDGLLFLKELREKGNSIPFIIFTEKGGEEVAIKALNLGADGYFDKTGHTGTVYDELTHGIHQVVARAWHTNSITDEKGKPVSSASIGLDITEARKTQEKLKNSEERLRILFEFAPDAYYLNDLKGNFIDGNKAAEEVTGYSRGELIGKSFLKLKLLPQSQIPKAAKLLVMNAMGKPTGPDEFILNRKDGTQVPVEIRTFPVKIEGQTLVLGIARDVSIRKEAERLVLENQQKFAGLFNSSPEAAAFLDSGFHILDINPRFISLFGFSIDEIQGKHIDDVVVQKNLMEEAEMLNKKAAKGYIYYDTVRMRKDRSLIPVSVSAAPIFIQDQLKGYIVVYKDISQLKKADEELREAMKKLELMNEKLRVVGGLTRHDVRNKLTAVMGNAYLARKKLPENSEVLDYMKKIEASVEQTVRILEFAKVYEMLGAEELVYIGVEKTVNEAISLFSGLKDIKVMNDCHGLTLLADSLLTQLFYNLIDNSLKYAEKLSRIRVYYEEKNSDHLKVIYEDDGVGIPHAAKQKLFDEGYTTGRGSGYGLFLVKRMMEVYGWTIQETGEPGKGAKFSITIPKLNKSGKENFQIV